MKNLIMGDCILVMAEMESNSVDAIVTDPPYALTFMGKSWDSYDGLEDAGFCYWLAGLIDGEGHFGIKAHSRGTHAPFFALKMRADERGLLELIRRTVGIGTITDEFREPHPMSRWVVQDKAGCARLVDLLDKYPLRAKKRNDFMVWRESVCEFVDRPRGNRWHGSVDNRRMAVLRDRLMAVRGYVDPPWSGNEFQDWCRLWASEALRILKPGGHLLSFGGTRTYHRMACAIEDAGFEIRDSVLWLYGSGFPKSLNVAVAIDKAAGAERQVVGQRTDGRYQYEFSEQAKKAMGTVVASESDTGFSGQMGQITAPATPEAAQWQGWGTAIKPAHEPIVVARKPLIGTVAKNVLLHGTGALNIDATRVAYEDGINFDRKQRQQHSGGAVEGAFGAAALIGTEIATYKAGGRWPANVVLSHSEGCVLVGQRGVATGTAVKRNLPDEGADQQINIKARSRRKDDESYGSGGRETVPAYRCVPGCPVAELDRQSGVRKAGGKVRGDEPSRTGDNGIYGAWGRVENQPHADTGGASRFFYVAKTSRAERNAGLDGERSTHPTVKPVALMRWLCRLVTQPGGVVLDPFMGSGSTGIACVQEGFSFIGIERDPQYFAIAEARITHAELAQQSPLF